MFFKFGEFVGWQKQPQQHFVLRFLDGPKTLLCKEIDNAGKKKSYTLARIGALYTKAHLYLLYLPI